MSERLMFGFIVAAMLMFVVLSGMQMGVLVMPREEASKLQQHPEYLMSVQLLRETDVQDGGLSLCGDGVTPYASSLVRERAVALLDRDVYVKMLMYDILEEGAHRGVELRVEDVADRRLLDEVAKKIGERQGLQTCVSGWERYEWCTLVEHDIEKGLLTVETTNGEQVTGYFFGSSLPPVSVFRIVTVDASVSFGKNDAGGVVFFTGIVSIEAVKE